jgi:hypothetical protein
MRRTVAIVSCALILEACAAQLGTGFHLPQGDALRGRDAFIALACQSCHTVEGERPPLTGPEAGSVILGGDTARVKTYGDLVTSIVNPSHEVARKYRHRDSLMTYAYLNDVITVQQLIDIVAFLQDAYEVVPLPVYWETYPSDGGTPPAEPLLTP